MSPDLYHTPQLNELGLADVRQNIPLRPDGENIECVVNLNTDEGEMCISIREVVSIEKSEMALTTSSSRLDQGSLCLTSN
jgi:hypothetical protein